MKKSLALGAAVVAAVSLSAAPAFASSAVVPADDSLTQAVAKAAPATGRFCPVRITADGVYVQSQPKLNVFAHGMLYTGYTGTIDRHSSTKADGHTWVHGSFSQGSTGWIAGWYTITGPCSDIN